MKQRTSLLRTYNNKLAGIYDHVTHERKFGWRAPSIARRLLVPHIPKKAWLLDLGIGTGQVSAPLARQGHHLVGVDISKEMLEMAKQKIPVAKLYQADVEKAVPMIDDNKFDAVVAVGVLEFVRDIKKVFRLARHALKSGGYFCFTFEECIPKSKTQQWKSSQLGRGSVFPIPKQISFFVYRRSFAEISKILSAYGFSILENERFVAYKRAGTDVVYQIILARRKRHSDRLEKEHDG